MKCVSLAEVCGGDWICILMSELEKLYCFLSPAAVSVGNAEEQAALTQQQR